MGLTIHGELPGPTKLGSKSAVGDKLGILAQSAVFQIEYSLLNNEMSLLKPRKMILYFQ